MMTSFVSEDIVQRNKHFIFDMDGVILSSVSQHFKAWQSAFSLVNISLTKEMYELHCDGISRMQAISNVLSAEDRSVSDSLFASISEAKQQAYLELIEVEPIQVYDDFMDCCRMLGTRGKHLYVCSSSKMAQPLLAKVGLDLYFSFILDGNLIQSNGLQSKPSPEPYKYIVDRFCLDPIETVAFEDSISGVNSTISAGLKTVWINRAGLEVFRTQAELRMVSSLYEIEGVEAK